MVVHTWEGSQNNGYFPWEARAWHQVILHLKLHRRVKSPKHLTWNHWGIWCSQDNYKTTGNEKPTYKPTQPKTSANTNMRIAQTIDEEGPCSNLGVSAGGAGTCWDVPQRLRPWEKLLLQLQENLLMPALVTATLKAQFTCALAGSHSQQLTVHQTVCVTYTGRP